MEKDGRGGALPLAGTGPAPYGLSPCGSQAKPLVPSATGWLAQFVRESNYIEGIDETTQAHIDAHAALLGSALTVRNIVGLVGVLQPNARFRNRIGVPGVRVGSHVAPPSGPEIELQLSRILAMRDPWEQHIAYETLHPFTDGNGRSGRAIWLHRHYHERALDPWACGRGFLHSWYYHTLQNVRLAQGIEAGTGETRQGLDAKRESPVGVADAPGSHPDTPNPGDTHD